MYSNEINNYLRMRNFAVTLEQLEDIKESSPQLTHIQLLKAGNPSSLYQIGTNDNYCWDIWVKNEVLTVDDKESSL